MNATDREVLKGEALRSLQGYLASGCRYPGLLQKGLDRLRAIGVDTGRCDGTPAGVEALLATVNRS